jgi:hypothetical protein
MAEPTKRTQGFTRIGSGLTAILYAGFVTLIVQQLCHLRVMPVVLSFAILWIGFYRAGIWAYIDRPTELRKKLPITGDEVRRRREAFYNWLNYMLSGRATRCRHRKRKIQG